MILLVLFVPAVMMAFLLAMDAFEELLFPRLTAAGDVSPRQRAPHRASDTGQWNPPVLHHGPSTMADHVRASGRLDRAHPLVRQFADVPVIAAAP